MTLLERVAAPELHDQRKHGLGRGHARGIVDSWTNSELLERISEALEEEKRARSVPESVPLHDSEVAWGIY